MTAIVGFVHKRKVYIGGDTATCCGWDVASHREPKVFRVGAMLFGFSGDVRASQVLRYGFRPPPLPDGEESERYLATGFADALRDCLKGAGCAQKDGDRERSEAYFLLGWRGRLFRFHGDYSFTESADGFDACGCGGPYALGALHAARGKPADRVLVALKAAERFSAGVRGPFVVECT